MMTKIFQQSFTALIIVMALVVGGACYQTICIVPFWLDDIRMFKNYGHWGINYFPILSPLMTIIWLITIVTGFKVKLSRKPILYIGHALFSLIMATTFAYFAPFLLQNMGHPESSVSHAELSTWARWDVIRQVVGLVMLAMFVYVGTEIRSMNAAKLMSLKNFSKLIN